MVRASDNLHVSPDWSSLRERFPIFESKTYINSCSCGALSTDVMAAFQNYLDGRLNKGSDWEHWVSVNEEVRSLVANLLGASADEIAVTTSASAGINALASALDFSGKRRKVVISDFEFPTTAQIWYAQEQRGATVVRAAERDGYVGPEQYAELIDDETQLVVVTQVCYRNGARLDIPAIAEIAKSRGARLMIDGYQGLGSLRFKVGESQPDFVAGGMVKYLLGTAGIGFLYVKQSLIDSLVPSTTGWFAQADVMAMDHTRYDPSPSARRFEAGTPPVPNCYAAAAGLRLIAEVGLDNIEPRIRELTATIKTLATEAGYRFGMPTSPEKHGAMISLQSTNEQQLVGKLEQHNIITSCRGGNLRISPHFYNNEQDIENIFRVLKLHEKLLVR